MADSITTRCAKLNQLFANKNGGRRTANLMTREALLDAFTLLFEECSSEYLMKDKNISTFVEKYTPMFKELRKLSLSKSDFDVVNTIGRGHFGEVHVVKDKSSGDVYAMKTLNKSHTLAQECVAFYEEEREIMATANNPWITSLQYAFQDSQCLFLVMDYHPGGDLLSLLSRYDDVLDEEMARFYLAEMVMAIHSLHMMGFVHRDVKPDNVLVDRTGHIKLADFGSSARLSSDKKVHSKMPVGTPEYICPEVLTSMDGSGGPYGVECDWWSLGVVAYEMLFGQTPFEADSVVVTYSKIMNFKNSMRFPSEPKISSGAKELILNLCTSSDSRIGYEGLGCHKFFSGIEWNKLQNTVPPYVPTLDGTDDTSNFDEFEPETDQLDQIRKYNINQEKGFGGKDLPFVGFTFIKNTSSAMSPSRRQSGLHNSPVAVQHSGHLERRLTTKTNELKSALHSCHSLKNEKDGMKKMLHDFEQAVSDRERALKKAENERDLLEKEKVLFDTQIKDLQRRLDTERAERNRSDSETLQLISELKSNRRTVEHMRDQETRALTEDQQHIIAELEQERFIANKRAHRLEEELRMQELVNEEGKNRINDLHARMSKMNEEAKRSMEEWQTKLDKVTTDSEDCISELERKLFKALESSNEATNLLDNVRKSKNDLEKELSAHKQSDLDEQDGRKACSDSVDKRRPSDEDTKLRERYREKTAELRKLQNKVMDLEDQMFKTQRAQKKLEKDANGKRAAEEQLLEKEKELNTLSRYKKQLESTNRRLQEDLAEKEKCLKENELKIKALKRRCQAENDTAAEVDNGPSSPREQDLILMEQQKRDREALEKELLCAQGDLKEQQQTTSSMKKKLQAIEDKLSEAQNDRDALEKSKKSLEETIVKLENEIDEKLLRQEMREANLLAFDEMELKEQSEIVQKLNSKLKETSKLYETSKSENKKLVKRVDELRDECARVVASEEKSQSDLKEKKRALEGQELTISMLKSTCTMLESQVEELEILNEEFEEKQVKWDVIRKNIDIEREKAECSLAEAQRTLEQEKANRTSLDENIAQLQRSLDEVQGIHSKEMTEKDRKLDQQRQRTEQLTEMLSDAEKQHGMATVELKSVERKLQLQLEEKNKYKIDSERLQSQLHNLKSINFELNQNIECTNEQLESLLMERAGIAEQLEVMETSYAEERLKLEATNAQQTKLIDFLQYKTEGGAPKKRKLIGGGPKSWRKQAAPDDRNNIIPKQWKDMRQALEKERGSSLKLQTELNRAKTELQATKMEVAHWKSQCLTSASSTPKPAQKFAVLSALQQSPSNQKTPLSNQANNANKPPVPEANHRPKERMHHNIPHRFVHVLNMHPVKCAVCLDSVHFGRQSSKCAECHSVCHVKCSPNLPHTCGLPSQFVEHFSEALQDEKMDSPDKSMIRSLSQGGAIEGWMKVPSVIVKHGWEKKWVILNDQKVMLFDKESVGDKSSPTETLHLDGTDGHVTIHSSVMASELLGSAPTDLPYIFRIESRPQCWPVQNLYLLAPSFKDKQRWVAALEATLDHIKKITKDKNDKKLLGNLLLRLDKEAKIDINCTQRLGDELVLLGAEEGLYSLSLNNPHPKTVPREIPGIGKAFQIELVPEHNLAVMIAGKERTLCSVDLKQLTSRARQTKSSVPLNSLTPQTIEKIKNCHLFAVGKYDGNEFICAATPNKLYLLRYNAGMNAYCCRKEIDTSEPCNCIYFTHHSVVYGIGKFFSLDLRQHAIKEFLDPKDTSLAFAVYGAAQLNIFPIAILDVTSPGVNNQEFLLCYNEFGVFVNSAGRQTRQKTLMWTRLPLAVAYNEPFLFVTHFNSIDVCEISPINSPNANSFVHKFLEIQNPRVLGTAVFPGAVYIASTMQEYVEMLCFQGSSAATAALHSDEDLADFSQYSTEMLRTISGATIAPDENTKPPSTGGSQRRGPSKRKSDSFRSNGPFKTPSMRKRQCYEVNPR